MSFIYIGTKWLNYNQSDWKLGWAVQTQPPTGMGNVVSVLADVTSSIQCKQHGVHAEFFSTNLNSFHRQIGHNIKEFISLVPGSHKIKFTDTKDFNR